MTTREALKAYDPDRYALVAEAMAYKEHVDWRYKRPAAREHHGVCGFRQIKDSAKMAASRTGGVVVTTMLLPSAPSAPSGPRPLHWTCAEFHRFGDMGVFEGRRAMLINGVILEEGPMNPPHAKTLGLVEETVRAAFGIGWWYRHQSPLVLAQDMDPEPDLAVVPGRPRDYAGHPTTADLVVEVADSSIAFDANDKRLLYARAGIREYWVVDINGRQLLVYRDPQSGDYASHQTFGPADAITPLAAPTATLLVADLLL